MGVKGERRDAEDGDRGEGWGWRRDVDDGGKLGLEEDGDWGESERETRGGGG